MKLNAMTFSINDDGISIPESITVTMTVKEALWAAIISGKQRGESPHSGIFNCLTGDVFNRYWDDGVDEARKGMNIETPPIVYED